MCSNEIKFICLEHKWFSIDIVAAKSSNILRFSVSVPREIRRFIKFPKTIRRQTEKRKWRFSPVKLVWENFLVKKVRHQIRLTRAIDDLYNYIIFLWRKMLISLVQWNCAFVRITFFARLCGKSANVFDKVWPTCDIRWKFYHNKKQWKNIYLYNRKKIHWSNKLDFINTWRLHQAAKFFSFVNRIPHSILHCFGEFQISKNDLKNNDQQQVNGMCWFNFITQV